MKRLTPNNQAHNHAHKNALVLGLVVVMFFFVCASTAKAQAIDTAGEASRDDALDNSAESVNESALAWPKTFRDWWQTPSQQAASAFRQGDNERLQKVAPTRQWQGAAAYQRKDYEAAKAAFSDESTQTLRQSYNSATADIQLGDYAAAIEQLDQILNLEPDNVDAARNRAIAERLLELEQESQQSENGESEEGESQEGESEEGESQDGESQQSGDQQNGENSESDSQTNPDSNNSEDNSSSGEPGEPDSEDASGSESDSQEAQEQEIEAARQALQQASDDAQSEANTEPNSDQRNQGAPADEPMSEEDQATEQWLRQIPDDPDDLLRRKLLQNHRTQYPDVQRNGREY